MTTRESPLLESLAESPWVGADVLRARLEISQPNLSRRLQAAGDAVLGVGSGSHRRYARRRSTQAFGERTPLYAVSRAGALTHVATVHATAPRGAWVEIHLELGWLLGGDGEGRYDDLPYMLHDLCPEGFLGRAIAQALARTEGVPENPERWNTDQILAYLVRHGHDLPGNLLLGDAMAEAFERGPDAPIEDTARAYPQHAARALEAPVPGAIVGGAHPKFTATLTGRGPVVVKYSPAGASAQAQRWRDLLIAEWHALETLREAEQPACAARLHTLGERVYLECLRFDRTADRGRAPALSLSAVDAEFTGTGESWSRCAEALARAGRMTPEDVERLAWRELFGAWIGDTDRHLGNVMLRPTPWGRFTPHPAYDTLPMLYAPRRGETPTPRLEAPPAAGRLAAETWQKTGAWALHYWRRLVAEHRLSADFRALAETNARLTEQRLARLPPPPGEPPREIF